MSYRFLLLMACCLSTLATLSAQPKKTVKNKPSAAKRAYHNLTGQYNAYYNAGLRIDKSFEELWTQHQDNYNKLLPLYPYIAAENAQSVKGPLDEAIKKVAINIELHRISHWVDDSYFLMGQAEFLKKEYKKSYQTFKFIVDKYNPNKEKSAMSTFELELAKKKEQKEKKEQTEEAKKGKVKSRKQAAKEAKKKRKKALKKRKQKLKEQQRLTQKKRKLAKQNAKRKKKGKPLKTLKTPKDKAPQGKRIKAPRDAKIVFGDPNKKPKEKKGGGEPEPEKTPEEEADDIYTGGDKNDKPDRYFLKHAPRRYEAMLWMVKALIELKEYNEAGLYLRLMASDGKVPYRLRGEVQAVTAHWFIVQKEYEQAIEPLELAVEWTKNRKYRSRYAYVLAQLFEKQKDYDMALDYYRKAMRWRSTYEMEFNARLNMARSAGISASEDVDGELVMRKMLRDPKNEEYQDQIYFALAEIQLRNGNQEAGIAALKQSMAKSSGFQRSETAYMLGEIYYERQDYISAYHYYDTCSQGMKKDDERIAQVTERKKQLKDVAEGMAVIALKDSVLKIADWPYDKQREWAMAARQAEKDKAKNAGGGSKLEKLGGMTTAAAAGGGSGGGPINSNAMAQSKFPLYNAAMRKKGEKDFAKRWGQRSYGDDWRRSSSDVFAAAQSGSSGDSRLAPITEEEVKNYLKKGGVPQNDAEKKKAHDDIQTALFKVGIAYREQVKRDDLAAKYLKRLLQDYPDTKFELESLYALYMMALDAKDSRAAEEYKQRILSRHGNSDIAKALKNPNHLKELEQKMAQLNAYYEETQAMVKKRQFAEALQRIRAVTERFGTQHNLKGRFAIMEAMCIGGTEGEAKYIEALRGVVSSFPNTPEEKEAKTMLAFLQAGPAGSPSPAGGGASRPAPSEVDAKQFQDNKATGHYVLVVFDNTKANTNVYRDKVVDYNKKNYSMLGLNVAPMLMDGSLPTLVIRKFKDGDAAVEYYRTVTGNPEFLGKDAEAHTVVVIGQDNYRTVLQKSSLRDYMTIFKPLYGL